MRKNGWSFPKFVIHFTKILVTMKLKIVNKSKHQLPAYSTEYSAGMDLRANIDEPVVLAPMQRAIIPTGLFIELPEGYEAQIPASRRSFSAAVRVAGSRVPSTVSKTRPRSSSPPGRSCRQLGKHQHTGCRC